MAWRLQGLQTRMSRSVVAGKQAGLLVLMHQRVRRAGKCVEVPLLVLQERRRYHMYSVVGIEVIMAVSVRKSVFWEVTPSVVVETYGHFEETGKEVAGSSETFVQTTGCHIARDSILHYHTLYYKSGYTLVTLPRIVTPYRDSVDGTRARVTYQKFVTQ
jgi:hypothetical protein